MTRFFDIFKKKNSFKHAGPGRRLCDDPPTQPSNQASSSNASNSRKESNTTGSSAPEPKPNIPSAATIAAREAALRRLETSTKRPSTKTGMERLLEEERRKIVEEAKTLIDAKIQTKSIESTVHPIDQCQRYLCTDFDIIDSYPYNELLKKIEQKLHETIDEELIRGAMLIKNCNPHWISSQCISTLELILNNLKTDDQAKLDKFKRVKKVKIENKILNCIGGRIFLESCGFRSDPTGEWYECSDDSFQNHLDYYLDVLQSAEKATIELDRQFTLVKDDPIQQEDEKLSKDFYEVKMEDISKRQEELRRKKELEETLMTKSQREKLTTTHVETNHTKLIIAYQDNKYSAMFKVEESPSDLVTLLMVKFNWDSFDNKKLMYLNRVLSTEDYAKSFKELKMYPSALVRVE